MHLISEVGLPRPFRLATIDHRNSKRWVSVSAAFSYLNDFVQKIMATWYYYDENGIKVGPLGDQPQAQVGSLSKLVPTQDEEPWRNKRIIRGPHAVMFY